MLTVKTVRGGGTDFSLGGRVSETMTWCDGPKLGGSGNFLNIDAIRSILGQFWYYLYPTHMSNCNKLRLAKPGQE